MRHILRQHQRKAAIVTLKSGASFRGVVFDVDSDAFVLRNSQLLEEGTDRVPVPVDGEVVILRPDIAFCQFL